MGKSNNILTKMASFKILLGVALVAFIGSTDAALKCMVKPASGAAVSTDCGAKSWYAESCVIKAKITAFKPANIEVTEAKCDDEDLGVNKTKKFDEPNAIAVGGVVTFYCKADNCNEAKIKAIVKDDGALTIAAIK